MGLRVLGVLRLLRAPVRERSVKIGWEFLGVMFSEKLWGFEIGRDTS